MKKVTILLSILAIAMTANHAQAQFVNKFDSVYFSNTTHIRVVNTFVGNTAGDTVSTKLRYAPTATMSPAVETAFKKEGTMVSGTTVRTVTVPAAQVYYFQVITMLVSMNRDTTWDTTGVSASVKMPTLTLGTLTVLQDGFRLVNTASSGNDSAIKTVTFGLDSLFVGSYVISTTKFNSLSFTATDTARWSSSSAYYWIKVGVRNTMGIVEKTVKAIRPQLPQPPYITQDSVSKTNTLTKHYFKIVTYGLNTKVFLSYGLSAAYGSVVTDSVIGSQGESLLAITVSGLAPGTPYHFGVIAKNAKGIMPLADYVVTTNVYNQPFILKLDSIRFSPTLNGLQVYTSGNVQSPSTSTIMLNLARDSMFTDNYKSLVLNWEVGKKYHFLPGPFTIGRYFANVSGFDWLYGYNQQRSDSMIVRIVSAVGIDELSKPMDFSGQYQLYDMTGRTVGGGIVEAGEMFSLKLRELALPPGIYVYRIRSDKDQKVLSGKIGRW